MSPASQSQPHSSAWSTRILIGFYLITSLLFGIVISTTSLDSSTAELTPDESQRVDHKLASVWGPGLRPDNVVLPARYFYIQARQHNGNKYTESLVEPYDIQIRGRSIAAAAAAAGDTECRFHTQQFDRGDGTVLVRYKLIGACTYFTLYIQHSGQPVAASPYRLPSNATVIRSSDCKCPRPLRQWKRDSGCASVHQHPQILSDLRPFSSVDMDKTLKQLLKRFHNGKTNNSGAVSLCHYTVLRNRIYRRCYGQYTGFKMFSDAVLTALVRQVRLPNFEMVVNLGDWPLITRGGQTRVAGPLPVFSWCGSDDTLDIVWPTYDLTESALQSMGRVMLDMQSVQAVRWRWEEKVPKAFWRGRDSSSKRLALVRLSRDPRWSDLFNVSLTNFFFFRDEEAEYGPRTEHMSFMDFFQYRWQLSLDGTVAAYRLPYLLGGDALVVKQSSPYYEHFYRQIEDGEHYVGVRTDLSDLVDKVKWARDNEARVLRIVQNAQKFARENLQADHVLCYHVELLEVCVLRVTD